MMAYEKKTRVNYKRVSRLMDRVKEYKRVQSQEKEKSETESAESVSPQEAKEFYIADTIEVNKSTENAFVKIDDDGSQVQFMHVSKSRPITRDPRAGLTVGFGINSSGSLDKFETAAEK